MNPLVTLVQILVLFSLYKDSDAVCNFPSGFTSKTWIEGRYIFNNDILVLLKYGQQIQEVSNKNLTFAFATYECTSMTSVGDAVTYVRRIVGSHDYHCVSDTLKSDGYILHKETTAGKTDPTIQECQTTLQSYNELFIIYAPAEISSNDLVSSPISKPLPFPPGTYYTSYYLINEPNVCFTESDSVMVVLSNVINYAPCASITNIDYPVRGSLKSLAIINSGLLGESPAVDDILLMEWSRENQRHVYCVRYAITNEYIHLSFDVTSSSSAFCKQNAKPTWYGNVEGRTYVRIDLIKNRFTPQTTPPTRKTTVYTQPTPSPKTTTSGPSTTSGSTTTSGPTTTTISTTTTSTPPTTTTPPLPVQYNQFTLSGLQFDDIKDKGTFVADLKQDIAAASGVPATRVIGLVVEKAPGGEPVVTYVIKPSTGSPTPEAAFLAFKKLVDTGTYTVTTQNKRYNVKKDFTFSWKSTSPCPSLRCASGQICWVIQNKDHKCVTSAPTSSGSQGSKPAPFWDKTTIAVIAGVSALVLLLLIVLVVVCVVRSRKEKKAHQEPPEQPYAFHHRGDSEAADKYNTNMIAQYESGRGAGDTNYGMGITGDRGRVATEDD